MRTTLAGILLLGTLPAFAAPPIRGEVGCDKGVDIAKVQALVKKTVTALKKDQDRVIQEINRGDKQWKDGEHYVFVYQGSRVLAHGWMPSLAGQDGSAAVDQDLVPYVKSLERMAVEKGEGCVKYKLANPARHGRLEDKVGYAMKVKGSVWAGSGTYAIRK